MPKLSQVSFTSGEVSPSLHARVDLQRYQTALKTCRNWIVLATGGVANRPGLQFIEELDATSDAFLLPFVYSTEQTYMMVMQEETAKVFTNGAFIGSPIATDYASDELEAIRYTQSADVLTLTHQSYPPSEIVRTNATTFTFGEIDDFDNGPFLDENVTATTVTASAATGTGITLTASTSIFTADHVGALFRIDLENLSAIPPWEPSKILAASGVNPLNLLRRASGKVYQCTTNEVAGALGTYTGTVRPTHDEGAEADGDGNPIDSLATRAGVEWTYRHSLFGVARITAVAGTTATADVLTYIPVISPATTTAWAFGAWSEDQGYPAVVTYYGDRLALANTPGQPQTEWLSKVGEYHNFGESSPIVADDAITQTLNARQVNAIVELTPLEQLAALTSSSSWASPQRGETLSPNTIGFYPQSYYGAANMRSVIIGDEALYVQAGGRRLRELGFSFERDKLGGEELTVLARHLFEESTIARMDYAEDPYGILWIVRTDGALIGLTYLKEQQVIGWHRHDTDGFFEDVCVIAEGGRDVPYFVVRRTIGGATKRFLERLSDRAAADLDILDSFFVDSGLSFDGRNETATTITISGASYDGGESVTLTASASLFVSGDVGDAILFDAEDVRATITGYTSGTVVTATLESPVPASLQATASAAWTFARDTFSGLDHLIGETVAILADGVVLAQQVVAADGSVTLDYPAGVVHVGLPYVSELETLEVTDFGPSAMRDRSKTIPKVSIVMKDSVSLKVGTNTTDMYEQIPTNVENYETPNGLSSGVGVVYPLSGLSKDGRVIVRQDDPLPATVLQIIPWIMNHE